MRSISNADETVCPKLDLLTLLSPIACEIGGNAPADQDVFLLKDPQSFMVAEANLDIRCSSGANPHLIFGGLLRFIENVEDFFPLVRQEGIVQHVPHKIHRLVDRVTAVHGCQMHRHFIDRQVEIGQKNWVDLEAIFAPEMKVSEVKSIIGGLRKNIMDQFESVADVVIISRASEPELKEI